MRCFKILVVFIRLTLLAVFVHRQISAHEVVRRSLDGSASDFSGCFLQVEGGTPGDLVFLPYNATQPRIWQAFDLISGAVVPNQYLYYGWGIWNMGPITDEISKRSGYFAGAGDANAVCLNDGATLYQYRGGQVATGRLWRLKSPVFTTCPLKRGKPVVSDSHLVALSEKDMTSLRDCTLHAVQEQPTASAVIYSETSKNCSAVVGQPASYSQWDPSSHDVASCVFGCYGVPAIPYNGQQPSDVTYVASAVGMTMEQCDQAVGAKDPHSQGAQVITPASTKSTVVCNEAETMNGIQPLSNTTGVDGFVCFHASWQPRGSTTSTARTGTATATTKGGSHPFHLSTTAIGIISGVGGLLVLVAVTALIYRFRRKGQEEAEEDEEANYEPDNEWAGRY